MKQNIRNIYFAAIQLAAIISVPLILFQGCKKIEDEVLVAPQYKWYPGWANPRNNATIQLKNGNFLTVTGNPGNTIVSLNSNAQENFVTPLSSFDMASDMALAETNSGDIFIGSNRGFSYDLALMKLNAAGKIQWWKYYGFSDSIESFQALESLSDGNLVMAGLVQNSWTATYSTHVLKLNTDGDTLWRRIFSWKGYSTIVDIVEAKNGDILLFGNQSTPTYTPLILRIKPNGELRNVYHMYGTSYYLQSALELDNGDFVSAGYSLNSNPYQMSINHHQFASPDSLIKTESHLLGYSDRSEIAYHINKSGDGNFILTGSQWDNFGVQKILVMKTNLAAEKIWYRSFGDNGSAYASNSFPMNGNLFIMGARTQGAGGNELFILKMDNEGKFVK